MTFWSFVFLAHLVPGFVSPALDGALVATSAPLEQLTAGQSGVRVLKAPLGGHVSLITGLKVMMPGSSPAEKATAFLQRYAAALGVSNLQVRETTSSKKQTVVHLDQMYRGLRVVDRSATVTFDKDGFIRAFNSDCGLIESFYGSTIQRNDAVLMALESLSRGSSESFPLVGEPVVKDAVIVSGAAAVRIYEVHVSRRPFAEHLVIRVDAHAGRVIGMLNTVIH